MESPISAFRFPLPAFPDSTRWHLFRFQLSTSRLPLSALILQVSSFKLQVSGLKFQVSAFLFLLCLAPLHAANQTWTGTTSNNWTTVTNWNGGAYPGNATTTTTNADIALFNTNPTNRTLVFDVANINLAGFTFDAGAGAFTLGSTGGNAVLLSSGGTTQVTSGDTAAQIINAPIVIENAAAAGSGAYSFLNNSGTRGSATANLTLGGNITGMATAGNTTALTFGGLNTAANTVSGIISDGTGGGVVSLTKTGSGNLTLSGTNTYTGATVANGGVVFDPMPGSTASAIPSVNGTLQITGNLTGTGSVLIANGGTLIDGSSTALSNNGITNRINSAATLTMGGANGGGTFTMAAPAASNTHSQTLAGLVIGAGGNIINANAATGTINLTFGGAAGSVYSRSTGGTVTFATGTAGFNVSFTNAPTGTGVSGTSAPILIGATLGGTTWGGTDFVAAGSGAVAAPAYDTTMTADKNVNVTGNLSASNLSINSLRLGDTSSRTVTLSGTLTIASGGILLPSTVTTDALNHTISGGNLTSGTGDLWIYAASGTPNTRSGNVNGNPRVAYYSMTIASAIVNNGATPVSLTVGGNDYSQVRISGTNTYTGGTYLANGMLVISSDANLGASTGNVTVTSGANYLRLNSAITTSRNFVINSGAMLNIGGSNLTLNGALTGGGDLCIGFYGGTNVLILNNAESGFTGTYTVASFLRANEGVGLSSNANLDLTASSTNGGGVLETSANVTRSLGTGPGQVQFTPGGNSAGGGFSAVGGPVTVSLGGIGTPTALTYGSGAFYVGATGGGAQYGLVLQDANANSTLTWANAIDTNGKTFFVNQAAPTSGNSTAATMTGVLSGTGNFTKAGAGQLILTGTNTYTGQTQIQNGVLSIATIGSVGTAGNLGQPATTANGTIAIGTTTTTGTLLYTGGGESSNRTIQIGINSATPAVGDTGGATIQNDGAAALTFSATNFNNSTNAATGVGANRTLTLTGTNTGTIQGIIQDNIVSGNATGTAKVALTKNGTGTWTLTGNNTYTGATSVTGGTLLVNGNQTSAAGAVAVASGAALGGNGTIGGATTIQSGGTLAPGNSPGIETFTSGLTLQAGSAFAFELNANTADPANRGTNFDGVNVTGGTLTVESGVNFNAIFNVGSTVDFTADFWKTSHSWLVFDNANAPTTGSPIFNLGTVSSDSFEHTLSGTLSFSQTGNDIYLDFSFMPPVPEPSTWVAMAALILTGGSMAMRRRASLKSIKF